MLYDQEVQLLAQASSTHTYVQAHPCVYINEINLFALQHNGWVKSRSKSAFVSHFINICRPYCSRIEKPFVPFLRILMNL